MTGEDDTPDSSPWIHNTLSLLAVYVIGFAGWFVSYKVGAWENGDSGTPDAPEDAQTTIEIVGLILGYISAILYLWYVIACLERLGDDCIDICIVLEFLRLSRTTEKSHAKAS